MAVIGSNQNPMEPGASSISLVVAMVAKTLVDQHDFPLERLDLHMSQLRADLEAGMSVRILECGCEHCDADITIRPDPADEIDGPVGVSMTTRHDDWCPFLIEHNRVGVKNRAARRAAERRKGNR